MKRKKRVGRGRKAGGGKIASRRIASLKASGEGGSGGCPSGNVATMAQADQEAGHTLSRRRCAGLVQAKTDIPEGDQSGVVEGDERRKKRVPGVRLAGRPRQPRPGREGSETWLDRRALQIIAKLAMSGAPAFGMMGGRRSGRTLSVPTINENPRPSGAWTGHPREFRRDRLPGPPACGICSVLIGL